MSNVNRAVTRTARAAPGHSGVPPAMHRSLALAQLHQQMHRPFTVTRRAPDRAARNTAPMSPLDRVLGYRLQTAGGWEPGRHYQIRLTAAQLRRAAKKARHNVAEWDLVQALGQDYARKLGWDW